MGLFKPAWQSDNEAKALKAVEKLTDQAKLVRAVREAPSCKVRAAAIMRLSHGTVYDNQSLLVDIARDGLDLEVREAAIKQLTDGKILMDIAKNDRSKEMRQAAISRLTGCSVLEEIKNDDTDETIRHAVDARITELISEGVNIEDFAKNSTDVSVRRLAISKVIDSSYRSVLRDIIKSDSNDDVRKDAGKRIKELEIADYQKRKKEEAENTVEGLGIRMPDSACPRCKRKGYCYIDHVGNTTFVKCTACGWSEMSS